MCAQAIALAPAAPWAYAIEGHVLGSIGHYDEGAAACEYALKLAPNYTWAQTTLTLNLVGAKRFDQAITMCDRVLEGDPHNGLMHVTRARALLEKKQNQEAINSFTKFIYIVGNDLGNPDTYIGLLKYSTELLTQLSENLLEELSQIPHNILMDTEEIPVDAARRTLEDAAAKAARETSERVVDQPRPQTLPADDTSPTALDLVEGNISPWRAAKARGESLPDYIARIYAPEIKAGTLAKADFYQDRKLYEDYYEWRKKPAPDELRWLRDLPTKHKRAAQQPVEPVRIDNFTPDEQDVIRRYEAAKRRVQRRKAPAQKASL
jgi:tetratricopeptide (TPR) repeat protein